MVQQTLWSRVPSIVSFFLFLKTLKYCPLPPYWGFLKQARGELCPAKFKQRLCKISIQITDKPYGWLAGWLTKPLNNNPKKLTIYAPEAYSIKHSLVFTSGSSLITIIENGIMSKIAPSYIILFSPFWYWCLVQVQCASYVRPFVDKLSGSTFWRQWFIFVNCDCFCYKWL